MEPVGPFAAQGIPDQSVLVLAINNTNQVLTNLRLRHHAIQLDIVVFQKGDTGIIGLLQRVIDGVELWIAVIAITNTVATDKNAAE